MKDIEVAQKMVKLQQSAKSRNLPFDLSFAEVKKVLTQKKCFFTGETFDAVTHIRSFDRVNNEEGYVNGNVVACTKDFNSKKANLSVSDIVLMYNGLKRKKII